MQNVQRYGQPRDVRIGQEALALPDRRVRKAGLPIPLERKNVPGGKRQRIEMSVERRIPGPRDGSFARVDEARHMIQRRAAAHAFGDGGRACLRLAEHHRVRTLGDELVGHVAERVPGDGLHVLEEDDPDLGAVAPERGDELLDRDKLRDRPAIDVGNRRVGGQACRHSVRRCAHQHEGSDDGAVVGLQPEAIHHVDGVALVAQHAREVRGHVRHEGDAGMHVQVVTDHGRHNHHRRRTGTMHQGNCTEPRSLGGRNPELSDSISLAASSCPCCLATAAASDRRDRRRLRVDAGDGEQAERLGASEPGADADRVAVGGIARIDPGAEQEPRHRLVALRDRDIQRRRLHMTPAEQIAVWYAPRSDR